MSVWDAAAAGVGVTAAASASLPIGSTVMLRILRAAFEDFLLVDATFPRQHLAGYDGPIVQVTSPDFHPNLAELNFYRRFRQAGGHLPLFGFDDADMVAALSTEMDAGKSRGLVIYTECEPTLWILEVLRKIPTASLLVRGASGASCAGLPSRGLLAIEVRQNDLQERYELVLPRGHLDAIAERTNEVLRSFPGAFTKRRSASWFGGVELVVYELELPSLIAAEAWTSINAGRFVHDGARRSEGDSRYFWIWVDRGRHLRVILGAIPVRKCTLRVAVAKVVHHANLETPLLLLNGERLATRCERWGDDCGAIISEILPADDGINVLGIAFPKALAVDDGSTALSACIDRIEIAG